MSGASVDLPVPGRALAIGAHPDDVEIGCGGTLAKWAAAGTAVTILVLTDGSKGTWAPDDDLDALVARREQEQRAAASVLGVTAVEFLRIPDGELDHDLATRARVCAAIRHHRPDVLIGHDPWRRYRVHPDHRHAGFLTLDGMVAARDPHFFPEQGLPAHRPNAALLFEAEVVDHYETVGDWCRTRAAALLAHRSQLRSTMGFAPDDDDARRRWEEREHERAVAVGRSIGREASEAFKLLGDL